MRHSAFESLRLVDLGLACVFFAGLAAWITAVKHLPTDYDEVYHAHAVWLIAQGDRPFHDFLAVHTPFLWYAVSPFLRWLPDSPGMLPPLRILAGLGTLTWLAAFVANLRCRASDLSLRWMLAGLCTAFFSTPVLAYAIEFRPDSWAFAVYFVSALIVRRRDDRHCRFSRYACHSLLATGASLACLKVAPFAGMFALFDLLRLVRSNDGVRRALLGYVSGVASAIVAAWLWLSWMQLDWKLVFDFTYRFQVVFERNTGFSHGLLRSLAANPLPLLAGLLGILAWGLRTKRSPATFDPFQASVIVVLIWELFAAQRPYKQYYGPWLLMAAPSFAYVEPFCHARLRNSLLTAALVLGGAAAASSTMRSLTNGLAPRITELQAQAFAQTAGDTAIIAPPPFHPIVRRDVFYAWSRTTDPAGYTTEPAMRDLGYDKFVTAECYRQELDRRIPSLIVLPLPGEELYEPIQWQVISKFLRRNAGRYEFETKRWIRPLAIERKASGYP